MRAIDPLERPGRIDWNIVNDERRGLRRGEWRERPRRFAHLPAADLEREVKKVKERWIREDDEREKQKKGRVGKS